MKNPLSFLRFAADEQPLNALLTMLSPVSNRAAGMEVTIGLSLLTVVNYNENKEVT